MTPVFLNKHLDRIYLVPVNGPYDERYFHEDIPAMDEAARRRDLERARHRLLLDSTPHPWLLEQIDMLTRSLDHAD